jgi:acetamidase/formamidase
VQVPGFGFGLKISQLVDTTNMLVSAFLPEDIFTS